MKTLLERFKFFHENAGYVVGRRAVGAFRLAQAEEKGERLGLKVIWEDEFLPWDGDCEAPAIHAMASIYHPDREDDARPGDKHFYVLAHLGSIGLNSWRDDYVRVVEAELMLEALDVLDDEDEVQASVLAERATYAGVSP